jgi:hypothetical protein
MSDSNLPSDRKKIPISRAWPDLRVCLLTLRVVCQVCKQSFVSFLNGCDPIVHDLSGGYRKSGCHPFFCQNLTFWQKIFFGDDEESAGASTSGIPLYRDSK